MMKKNKPWKASQDKHLARNWNPPKHSYNSKVGNALIEIRKKSSRVTKLNRYDPSEKIEVYFDGSFVTDGVTKIGIGVSIYKNGYEIVNLKKTIEKEENLDSSIAEYLAFIEALILIRSVSNVNQCSVYTDSKLISNQVNGVWKVNKEKVYAPYAILALDKMKELSQVIYIKLFWVSRDWNARADELSKIKEL